MAKVQRSEKQVEQVEKHLLPNRFQKGETSGKAAAGQLGGVASGVAKRQRKTYREIAQALRDEKVEVKMPDGTKQKIFLDEAVILGLYAKSMKGDHNAAKLLLEIQGEYQNTLDLTGSLEAPAVIVGNDETAVKLRAILDRNKAAEKKG